MTSSEEDTVQLFADGDAPDFANLATWFDASAGRYFGYEPSQAIRDISYIAYRRFAPTGTPDRFASVWPRIWELNECAYGEWAPMAVLDTGVMTQHPLLKPQILYAMDFTGEGVEDDVGHGTAVTMRLRMQFPGQPPPFLVVLKVVGRSGRGSEDNLLAAFDWIRRFNQAATQPIFAANLSLGICRRRWGFLDCDGSCRLCRAAIKLSREVLLCVAAGNMSGQTACPARAGLLANQGKLPPNSIISITSSNEPGLGIGGLSAPSGGVVRRFPI